MPTDKIMKQVRAVKDALSLEAGYDVTRLIEASERRNRESKADPAKTSPAPLYKVKKQQNSA